MLIYSILMLLVLIAIFIFVILLRRRDIKDYNMKKIKNKTVILLILIGILIVLDGFTISRYLPLDYEDYDVDRDSISLNEVDEEMWGNLSYEDRMNVIYEIAKVESSFLSISEVNIKTRPMLNTTIGRYDELTNTIILNLRDVKEGTLENVTKSTCHLMYHAYMFQVIKVYENTDEELKDLLIFDEAKRFTALKDNYICTRDSNLKYYNYTCEVLARLYEEEAYERINNFHIDN